MHITTHMLYAAAPHREIAESPVPLPDGTECYLCGARINEGVHVKARIGITWTAHGLAAAPLSSWLCVPCFFCLQEKCGVRPDISPKFTFRAFSHLVTESRWEVIRLSEKARLLAPLLDPPDEAWALAISTSPTSAPHILPFTPVNDPGASEWVVNFGGQVVRGEPSKFGDMYDAVLTLYENGFTKAEILSGNYQPLKVGKNMALFRATEEYLARKRGSSLFELAVFLVQKGALE